MHTHVRTTTDDTFLIRQHNSKDFINTSKLSHGKRKIETQRKYKFRRPSFNSMWIYRNYNSWHSQTMYHLNDVYIVFTQEPVRVASTTPVVASLTASRATPSSRCITSSTCSSVHSLTNLRYYPTVLSTRATISPSSKLHPSIRCRPC